MGTINEMVAQVSAQALVLPTRHSGRGVCITTAALPPMMCLASARQDHSLYEGYLTNHQHERPFFPHSGCSLLLLSMSLFRLMSPVL